LGGWCRHAAEKGVRGAPTRHAQTHVVCTLGPSSRTVPQLCDLLTEGMSVARFNFSHGR